MMTRYLNLWTALCAWAMLMLIVWTLFVPKGLSVGTFTMLGLTATIVLAGGALLWKAQQPSPSIRQTRATVDSQEPSRPRLSR